MSQSTILPTCPTALAGASDLSQANTEFVTAAIAAASITAQDTHGADIASASTVNLETATGDIVDVTGTTTITAITLSEGHRRIVRFTGALILTHGSSLVLPTSANITTAAGDFAVFVGYAAGVVRCVSFNKLTGQPNNFKQDFEVITGDGAITIKSGLVMLTKGSAAAITLAAPSSQNGTIIKVTSTTDFAHVITVTGGMWDGTATTNTTATFTVVRGSAIELVAYGTAWYVLSLQGVVCAP